MSYRIQWWLLRSPWLGVFVIVAFVAAGGFFSARATKPASARSGGSSGISTANNALWNEASVGIDGDPQSGDLFGQALATGDFNNDGHVDLAVGIPGETVNSRAAAGAVEILYGPTGADSLGGQAQWTQDSTGVPGTTEANDMFGQAVATGDFNHDGFVDLAIGAPGDDAGEGFGSVDNAGSVTILYGSSGGLTAAGAQIWDQSSQGVAGDPLAHDLFGAALASGDFNGDGYADLVIGIPGEGIGGHSSAGAVTLLYGSQNGLVVSGVNATFYEGLEPVPGTAETGDAFGTALATGDFNHDGADDLAVGVPGEGIDVSAAGAVFVFYGSLANGLMLTGSQFWNKNVHVHPGTPVPQRATPRQMPRTVRHSPRATSTATASTTWRSACRAKLSDGRRARTWGAFLAPAK